MLLFTQCSMFARDDSAEVNKERIKECICYIRVSLIVDIFVQCFVYEYCFVCDFCLLQYLLILYVQSSVR